MTETYQVLFLCTGNSARSILAEAILNKEGKGRFRAYSAGSRPRGEVHPAATRLLAELGYPLADLRSKSWSEFAGEGAPEIDFIITVCDDAAGETCPVWPGRPTTVHWGIPDPARVDGEGEADAFWDAYCALERRISLFLALPIDSIDELSLHHRMTAIGHSDEARAGG